MKVLMCGFLLYNGRVYTPIPNQQSEQSSIMDEWQHDEDN